MGAGGQPGRRIGHGRSAQEADDVITVSPDGSGDHTSIREAIEERQRPAASCCSARARYEEGFVIDKAITLSGDGPRDEIVIAPRSGGRDHARGSVG